MYMCIGQMNSHVWVSGDVVAAPTRAIAAPQRTISPWHSVHSTPAKVASHTPSVGLHDNHSETRNAEWMDVERSSEANALDSTLCERALNVVNLLVNSF